jgi:hypothetical protein
MAQTWRRKTTGNPIHVSLAAGTLTLSFDGAVNLSFDGEGRMVGAWFKGLTYRRGLDNRVLLKWSEAERPGQRRRRFLTEAERRALLEEVYGLAGDLAEDLRADRLVTPAADPAFRAEVAQWLDVVAGWTWPRLEAEAARFAQVYKPVSIMPPDQYLALVLQATEGCSYNECSFCTFYRDRPFRIHTPAAFETHLDRVDRFLGRGVTVRRSIFLADANAVIMPQARLLPLLDLVNAHYPILPVAADKEAQAAWKQAHPWYLTGIYAFVSAPAALRKTAADFAAMRARNVSRLYVGLETGHDPLRRFLRKEGDREAVLAAVEMMKAGGIDLGIIVMVGIGGQTYRAAHFRDTIDLIRRMPLDHNDLVYLSPFVASDDAPYVEDVRAAGIAPLDEAALDLEERRFRKVLRSTLRAQGVRISRYDIREFLY